MMRAIVAPRIGLAGLGTVGRSVARAVAADATLGTLVGVTTPEPDAADTLKSLGVDVPILSIADLAQTADVVVEGAPPSAFRGIAEAVLEQGRTLIACSSAGLLANAELVELARRHGGRILLPSCSLPGIDGVVAAAQGKIHSARIVTRKPPASLVSAPAVAEAGIDLASLDRPVRLFAGTAREAARAFPANVNVAATLSLAGIGADLTMVEVWADPGVERNTHRVEIDADSTRFSVEVANIPDPVTPRTGLLTANGVIATIRKLSAPLVLGI